MSSSSGPRSLPGTNRKITDLIEQISKKKAGKDFSVVSNPEFLREGTAVHDFLNPPYTLIGTADDRGFEVMKRVYGRSMRRSSGWIRRSPR